MSLISLKSKSILYVLLRPLGVHQGEETQVLLLLCKGFFLGIFIATYYTGANTLFLNTFDDSYLSQAFITSGIAGVISTYLFSRFQGILSFGRLTVINLMLIAVTVCVLRLGFEFTDNKWLIFMIFVLNVPLSALSLLGFWGIVARMFNLRQAKRIIGSIDTGQLSAIIIAFYATPIITIYITETINFFLISAISIVISLIFLIIIVSNYNLETSISKEEKKILNKKIKFKELYKNNYVTLLSLFLIFSMVAFVFVDYSFLSVTKVKYPEEVDLANFLGVFNGSIMILSFLMQTFVNDKLIAMYGLKVSLLVLPVLLGILTIISALVGSVFGYSMETGTFLFFFLFISLSKLITTSLRDALENPTIKLFFLPLESSIRFDIQTKIEGVINQLSVLIAGGIIFLFGLIPFVNVIHYSYLLLFVIAGWIYIAGKIYFEYRNTLKKKLEEQKKSINLNVKGEATSIKLLEGKLNSQNYKKIKSSLKLLEKIEPIKVETSLSQLVKNNSPEVRMLALNEVTHLRSTEALQAVSEQIQQEKLPHIKTLAEKALENLKEADNIRLSNFQFFILVKATDPEDRKYAAKLLGKVDGEEYNTFMLELLRDINPDVRIAALISAGRLKRPEFWTVIIENLSSHIYEASASSALVAVGPPVIPVLNAAFYKSGQSIEVMEKIIKVFGEIGGDEALRCLWEKIDYPDKTIISATLNALHKCKYQATDFKAIRLKQFIEFDVRNIAWTLAALRKLPKGGIDKNRLLRNCLREENNRSLDHIYMLLSMLYDEQSIQLVKENIESRTSEGVTFAIELLDVFLDEDIKPFLLIVLDDLPAQEKLERLENYFPVDYFDNSDVLVEIMNLDYNRISPWTKACAIYTYRNVPRAKVCDDLIANLFNQDPLIKETAAYTLYCIDPSLYHKHTYRLGEEVKDVLDEIVCPDFNSYGNGRWLDIPRLRMEKIMFLKSITALRDTPGALLNKLLEFVEIRQFTTGDEIRLSDEENEGYFFLIHTGSANILNGKSFVANAKEKEMIGEFLYLDGNPRDYKVVVAEEATMFLIDKYRFFSLLSGNVRLTQSLVTYMSSLVPDEIEVKV